MHTPTSRLAKSIDKQINGRPIGSLLMPKEFTKLASRAAVDQAFYRLVKEGRLLRIARGMYIAPIAGQTATRIPPLSDVLASMGRQRGEAIVSHCSRAAFDLRLTPSTPSENIYLTSGRSRMLTLGASEIRLEHAPAWMFPGDDDRVGPAVRAMSWIGSATALESAMKLRNILSPIEWSDLLSIKASLPRWMATAIDKAT